MKVYMGGTPSARTGGMFRVHELLRNTLPLYGVEFVDTMEQADVTHAHINLYESIPVGMPLVLTSHGLLWDEHAWGEYAWGVNKRCFESCVQADVVTAPSFFVANAISRNTLVPARVVHHGIDTAYWTPDRRAIPKGYILWNKARVDAANDPYPVEWLAEHAPEHSFKTTFGKPAPNVEVVGQVAPDQIRELVRGASVYLDTPKESGGPCFGVLEAMACGVPVLAWNNGGNAEVIVHGETGYLAEPDNYDDLLAGLHYCYEHFLRLGDNAREEVVAHYQDRQVVKGYVQAYEDAIKAHHKDATLGIVVPCYNLGRFVPACIDSVLQQSFQDWQLVLVDDASTDNSWQVIQEQAKRDPRIRAYQNVNNRHVSDTRNFGIGKLNTSYIIPLDADDRVAPHALQRMVEKLDTDRSIQITAGVLALFSEDDLDTGYNGPGPYENMPFEEFAKGNNFLPYFSMYRKSVWENLGGYRRRIKSGVEDADFWTRASAYGYRATMLPQPVTLWYTIRRNSLKDANKRGTEAWLSWYPWKYNAKNIPAGAITGGPYPVEPHDTPLISVVIPVGPGHLPLLQTAIDSVLSQTFTNWEIIVINDTGRKWFDKPYDLPYFSGMSFVRFIDKQESVGVAEARNLGIKAARGEWITFLDADDMFQPHALEALASAAPLGGWFYGDWYSTDGNVMTYNTAPDWNFHAFINQMLAPITGLYKKEDLELVGGFTDCEGWEDWDLQLKLVSHGICGTAVAYPLILYYMNTGYRREENLNNKQNLIQYIYNKFRKLYQGDIMGCSKCGGKPTHTPTMATAAKAAANDGAIRLVYNGPIIQSRHFKSPHHYTMKPYKVTAGLPFVVYADDVGFFLQYPGFSVVENTPAIPHDNPVYSDPVVPEIPVDVLQVSPETLKVLRDHFRTRDEIVQKTDADLLGIKGIGPARLLEIRKALA